MLRPTVWEPVGKEHYWYLDLILSRQEKIRKVSRLHMTRQLGMAISKSWMISNRIRIAITESRISDP